MISFQKLIDLGHEADMIRWNDATSKYDVVSDIETLARFAELVEQNTRIELMPEFEELKNRVVEECIDVLSQDYKTENIGEIIRFTTKIQNHFGIK